MESGLPGPHLLITAGVHGDEFEPMEASRRVYNAVKSNEEALRGKLTIIPVVNEPAFQMVSRMGPDHLDLARVCPGNENGSVTEKIAFDLSKLIRTADYYIDLHNGGRLHNIYPFVGYMLHQDESILDAQRQLAKSFMLPIVWGTDPDMEGRTLSVARDANIPAIYAEIGGGGGYDEEMTKITFESCMNILRHLKMIPGKQKKERTKYHLEDFRKNSGHLQKLLPSPCDGFFIPKVIFGQHVETGDILGHIVNELGENKTDIKADQTGIVFILRNPPSVKKGDALGAIFSATDNNTIQSIQ